jgi:hypothetical protein
LNQLQTDYQQFLTKQQNLQQAIQSWENRKREIDLVITVVKEWKSTAYSRLYQILNNCQQSGQLLTNYQVQLPSKLLQLASSSNLPLVPTNYTVNKIDYLPDWVRLRKALSFEIEGGFINLQGKQYNFGYFLYISLTETPMVLSTSDRLQWQEIAEKFINYPRLDTNQRRLIVKNTQQFLSNMQQIYGASWQPNNIESTLNRITQELLESILTNARQCVLKVKTEIQQQLQPLQNQLNELQKNEITQQQISTAENHVEIARQDANLQLERVINILQELTRPNVPAQLRILAEQYLTTQAKIWEQHEQFSTQVHNWESHTSKLESLILSLEPFTVLENIKNSLHQHLSRLEQETTIFIDDIDKLQKELCKLEKEIQPLSEDLISERNWWHTVWQGIPDKLKPDISSTELFNLDFLRSIKKKFNSWQKNSRMMKLISTDISISLHTLYKFMLLAIA